MPDPIEVVHEFKLVVYVYACDPQEAEESLRCYAEALNNGDRERAAALARRVEFDTNTLDYCGSDPGQENDGEN